MPLPQRVTRRATHTHGGSPARVVLYYARSGRRHRPALTRASSRGSPTVALSIALGFLGCLALAGFVLHLRRQDAAAEIRARLAVIEQDLSQTVKLDAWKSAASKLDDHETRLTRCERATSMKERFAPQAFPAP
jgi:hypothetical protein